MNREKNVDNRPLHLIRLGVKTEYEMNDMIDKEMVVAKAKTKSWKQLDMYLKWQTIMSYLTDSGIHLSGFERFKNAFKNGKMTNIEYDAKRQTISKLNYKSI